MAADISPNTLPLYTNLDDTEFPGVPNLSHLHVQLSYMSGIHHAMRAQFERQALRGSHWSTPVLG